MQRKRQPAKLTDQLRHAIQTCGKTRYVIAKETGLTQAVLSRFMHGTGGLSMDGLDKLGECLGLNLAAGTAKGNSTSAKRNASRTKA